MIEQQLTLDPARDMLLFWGATNRGDCYRLQELAAWVALDTRFRVTLTARVDSIEFRAPVDVKFHQGRVCEALAESELDLVSRDAYVAGPTKTGAAVVEVVLQKAVPLEYILVDSFGI